MASPKKFSIQQVFELLIRDIETKEIKAYLDDLKTSGLENTVEMVYPTGGRGNVYVGGAFAHSRRATFNVENAVWNTEVMAVQNGTEIITDNVNVIEYEVATVSGTTVTTKHTAIGTSGSEIGFVYVLNTDGTYGTKYTQGTTATGTTFSYSSANKTITLPTTINGSIAFAYTRATEDGAQKLTVNSDSLPKMALVTAYGIAKDICNGKLYACQIDGQAQIDGNYTIDVSADGEPSVHALNMEFVKGCTSKRLYDFIVYDEID